VHSGGPNAPPDQLEPLRVAQAAAQMHLKDVVVTSVDRDDVPDRGAGHYAATIRAIKAKLPNATVEVLTPDFLGVEEDALHTVLAARPEVFNHNIETVRRLHPHMRGAKASYGKALWLLRRAKELAKYPVLTKSGIIRLLRAARPLLVPGRRAEPPHRHRRDADTIRIAGARARSRSTYSSHPPSKTEALAGSGRACGSPARHAISSTRPHSSAVAASMTSPVSAMKAVR
jgi:hypothetical protein